MLRLVLSNRFKENLRNFLKKHPELEKTFRQKLTILQRNPHDPQLKTHKLTGKLKDFLGASIDFLRRSDHQPENRLIQTALA